MEALNAAMVVAYSRPFSGNDRHTRPQGPRSAAAFLARLNDAERLLHEAALSDRNTVVAHSDAEARNYQPVVVAAGENRILLPWSSYTRAPLTREGVATLASACQKLMDAVLAERMVWEPQMIKYFSLTSTAEMIEAADMDMTESGSTD